MIDYGKGAGGTCYQFVQNLIHYDTVQVLTKFGSDIHENTLYFHH